MCKNDIASAEDSAENDRDFQRSALRIFWTYHNSVNAKVHRMIRLRVRLRAWRLLRKSETKIKGMRVTDGIILAHMRDIRVVWRRSMVVTSTLDAARGQG